MGKKIITFLLISLVYLGLTHTAIGQESAGSSAQLDNIIVDNSQNKKSENYNYIVVKLTIKSILKDKYNSPLAEDAETFTETCFKYNLNCFLLPSIAGLESTFGKFVIQESHNPFGWGGGRIFFESWSDAIATVGKSLRENYLDKWGAKNLAEIGQIYAESKTWTPRVAYFMSMFEEEYEKNLLYFPSE